MITRVFSVECFFRVAFCTEQLLQVTLYLFLLTFNVTILPSFAMSSFLKVIETRNLGSTFVFHVYLALIKSNLCNAVVEDLHIIQSSNSLCRKGIPFLNCFSFGLHIDSAFRLFRRK